MSKMCKLILCYLTEVFDANDWWREVHAVSANSSTLQSLKAAPVDQLTVFGQCPGVVGSNNRRRIVPLSWPNKLQAQQSKSVLLFALCFCCSAYVCSLLAKLRPMRARSDETDVGFSVISGVVILLSDSTDSRSNSTRKKKANSMFHPFPTTIQNFVSTVVLDRSFHLLFTASRCACVSWYRLVSASACRALKERTHTKGQESGQRVARTRRRTPSCCELWMMCSYLTNLDRNLQEICTSRNYRQIVTNHSAHTGNTARSALNLLRRSGSAGVKNLWLCGRHSWNGKAQLLLRCMALGCTQRKEPQHHKAELLNNPIKILRSTWVVFAVRTAPVSTEATKHTEKMWHKTCLSSKEATGCRAPVRSTFDTSFSQMTPIPVGLGKEQQTWTIFLKNAKNWGVPLQQET